MKNLKLLLIATCVAVFAGCSKPTPPTPVGGDPVERTVLLEEFTGVACMYCPRGAATVEAAIKDFGDKVVVVRHHTGFGDDVYTIPQSRDLRWFYGVGASTFAPAAMLDRTTIVDKVPVFNAMQMNKDMVAKQLSKPSYVVVDIKHTYNADTRILDVEALGEIRAELPNARLTIYLIQEGLVGKQTTEDGTYDEQYKHKHAVRNVITEGSFGEPISTTDKRYSMKYEYRLPEKVGTIDVDPNQIYIVAFVADFIDQTAESINKSEVHNVTKKKLIP